MLKSYELQNIASCPNLQKKPPQMWENPTMWSIVCILGQVCIKQNKTRHTLNSW